jgi:hypothetical protein
MSAPTAPTSADLPCHGCGYDLRAHPPEGQCPECRASVAEARRVAAVPRRPAWRDSDPRWRRRILAGAWVLVLLPLVDVLRALGWASSVPVPTVFGASSSVRTLDDTFLASAFVYQPLAFCVGVVLLFAKERGRRAHWLDWTRRWGVLCCYVVLLLSAAGVLFLTALVGVGIAAVFASMPLENQPAIARPLVGWTTAYFRYGPQPTTAANLVLVAFSSVAVLLACVPLFDALCSTGPKRAAAVLLAPLALFAGMHLAGVARSFLGISYRNWADASPYGVYFCPDFLVRRVDGLEGLGNCLVEAIKWCAVFGVAVWLSVAQLAAWKARRRTAQKRARSPTARPPSGQIKH